MRWPIMSVPGDRGARGPTSIRYRKFALCLTRPTLPIRAKFPNALPASFAQVIIGQPRSTTPARWPYTGITMPQLFPVIQKRRPWE